MEENNKKRKMPDAINCSVMANYTLIPDEILRNKNLSGIAVKIYGIILAKKEGETLTMSKLKSMMKESVTAIHKGIKELEDAGYIK